MTINRTGGSFQEIGRTDAKRFGDALQRVNGKVRDAAALNPIPLRAIAHAGTFGGFGLANPALLAKLLNLLNVHRHSVAIIGYMTNSTFGKSLDSSLADVAIYGYNLGQKMPRRGTRGREPTTGQNTGGCVVRRKDEQPQELPDDGEYIDVSNTPPIEWWNRVVVNGEDLDINYDRAGRIIHCRRGQDVESYMAAAYAIGFHNGLKAAEPAKGGSDA